MKIQVDDFEIQSTTLLWDKDILQGQVQAKGKKKNQTQGRNSDCCAPKRHEAIQEKDKNQATCNNSIQKLQHVMLGGYKQLWTNSQPWNRIYPSIG